MNINTSPNSEVCQLSELPKISKTFDLKGDILEFGTFSCESAIFLSTNFKEKTVFTIDHFEGLEKSNKKLPTSSDWSEGMFGLKHPWFKDNDRVPKSKEDALKKLSPHPNVKMIISDVHKLANPIDYGIGKIGLVNLDVDIYEPTVSSLEFLTLCEWSEVFIRFDDWHGGDKQYDQHERLAFSEWVTKYNYNFVILYGGSQAGIMVRR